MGLFELANMFLGKDNKTDIPKHVRRFIEEINSANRIRTTDPETPIGDVIKGYEKGDDKIIEFKKRLQCLGIITQEFDFNPISGRLNASNWYFHIDDILPSIETLMNHGSAQIKNTFGANMQDMFSYANQYGAQNDYGRIHLNTALINGRLSLEKMTLKIEFSESEIRSLPELAYNRTNSAYSRKYAVQSVVEEVNKRRKQTRKF